VVLDSESDNYTFAIQPRLTVTSCPSYVPLSSGANLSDGIGAPQPISILKFIRVFVLKDEGGCKGPVMREHMRHAPPTYQLRPDNSP
jgi:hypothetical protein